MDKETKDLGEVNKEKDLMAKDVLQMMMKLVIGLVLALLVVIGAFISYAVYKDNQYNEFINSFEYEVTDEYVDQSANDGGDTNFIKGDGNVLDGKSDSADTQNPN